jgi:hypothetical protein
MLVVLVVATVAAFGLLVVAVPGSAISSDVNVPGTAGGPNNGGTAAVSTGIVIPDGASVTINASGTIHICGPSGCANGPDGGNPGNSTANSLVPSSPYGCLAARVGSGAWECIGSSGILDGPGEIQFGVNDDFVGPGVGYDDNFGSFTVVVGQPHQTVTVRKTVTGTDPGVSFPVSVSCTSTPIELPASVGATAADGQIVLGDDDTQQTVVSIPSGGSATVDVWWPVTNVENVTCTVAEGAAVLPAGAACSPTITPSNHVVLFDLGDEINQSGSFVITNACTVPVAAQPTFTG